MSLWNQPDAPVTERQHLVARVLRDSLHRHGAEFTEAIEAGSGDSIHAFEIATNDPRLTVHVRIVDDAFHFQANEALLVVDLGSNPDRSDEEWADECLQMLEWLLDSDLRLRIRERLLGGPTGAIWVSGEPGTGAWSGEACAVQGRGTESVFPDWYRRSDPRP